MTVQTVVDRTRLPGVSGEVRWGTGGQTMGLEKGSSPVIVGKIMGWLNRYPDKEAAGLLGSGFQEGFVIPCSVPPSGTFRRNLKSARQHPGVVRDKLAKEVGLGRMAGPFVTPPIPGLVVSPLGVVPKKEPGKFRLIHHLSFPKGGSVNDGISPEAASVSYTTFDFALGLVWAAGPGALMAKTDIESAFRLLLVHPDSQYLLGCYFEGGVFIDRCLPMGCSVSCAYFEAFCTFLEWVVKKKSGLSAVTHYLDDFFCVGPADSRVCDLLLSCMLSTFDSFGVPVATEKTEGPRTCMSFLGIEIDSQAGVCRLPLVKVRDLLQELQGALLVKKVTLRQLQSVLGKLNFACKVLPMGRVFSRRLSLPTAGVKEAHHFIRLTGGLKEDLRMWVSFLSSFNGLVYWLDPVRENREVGLFTDAAGSTGFGAYFAGRWCAAPWPERVRSSSDIRNLALLELFPVVVALALWGEDLQNKSVLFHSDNMAVVSAINAQTASSPVVKLLRQLVLSCLQYNILFRAVHVPGVANGIADALSRFQMDRFRELAPEACTEGEECPDWVWRLI
ncbi:LOW QUALITY PROTEIN: uncharacterized protein PAF06_003101 [Gastrophryne carolinensis]